MGISTEVILEFGAELYAQARPPGIKQTTAPFTKPTAFLPAL
jgi:hypothetical protein